MLWTFVLVVIATLHILALEFSLYWLYPWFDIMVHFLGGLFTALFALWLFFESGYVRINNNVQNALLVAGVSILVIGIGWEIFELVAGVPIEDNFVLDTTIDLIMDVLGAGVAVFIFIHMYIKGKEHGE